MSSMDTRLAELSRTIDQHELGRRIRHARIAAGLTQAALAADEVTSAYVSRIEDGQRRPEFSLLGRMATRMGTSLEALLAEPGSSTKRLDQMLALDHAELALAGGQPTKALNALDALAPDVDSTGPDDLRRRYKLIRAGALEATGDLNGAIIGLEDLCATPTRSPEWLRSLIALCRCYRDTGELDRAIAVGERAEEQIADLGLNGLTESIQLSVTVAGAYMQRGDLSHAMRICLRAIERAEQVGSPIAKASAYWNASLIESQNGASFVALDLARKALGYFEAGEDSRNLARLRGQVADLQLQVDPPDAIGAIETLERAFRELDWTSCSPVDRSSQLQTRARAHLMLGDTTQALIDIQSSLEIVPTDAALEQAYGFAVLGEIKMHTADVAGAREAFLSAVRLLSAAGSDREAAQLWLELGNRLREVGETEAAFDALQRAAASAGLKASSTWRNAVPVENS